MAMTNDQFLQAIFVAYYGRAAAAAGFAYWKGQFTNNVLDHAGIAENFAQQLESIAKYAYFKAVYETKVAPEDITDTMRGDFVDEVFQNMFGRAPTAEGKAYWVGQLKTAGSTPGAMIAHMINSASTDDAATVAMKAKIAEYFTNQLIETGYDWTQTMSTDVSALIAAATKDTVLDDVKGEVDNILDAGGGGETFTLTTDADNVSANYGVVEGMIAATLATSTLQINDKINATNARLEVILDGGNDLTPGTAPSMPTITSMKVTPTADNSVVDMNQLPNVTSIEVVGSGLQAAAADEITFNNVNFAKASSWALSSFGAGRGEVDVNITSGDTATSDVLGLTLRGTTGAGGENFNIAGSTTAGSGGGIEGLDIVNNVAASRFDCFASTDSAATNVLKTVTISGSQNLRIDDANGLNLVTGATVDAGKFTGSLNAGITAAGTVAITTGSGNDRIIMDSITSTKTIDLGTGTNTVGISGNTAVADGGMTKVSNATKFEIAGTSTAQQDVDHLGGISELVISSTGNNVRFTDIADGSNVQITSDTGGTTVAQLKTNSSADTLNLMLGSTDGTAQTINQLDVNAGSTLGAGNVEDVTIDLQGTGGVTITTNGLDVVRAVVTGGNNFNVGTLTAVTTSFDARAATGDITVEALAAGTQGVTIRTGSGADTVTLDGAGGGDVTALLGAGNDTLIVAGAQEHSVTLGDGSDVVRFSDLATAGGAAISALTEYLTINDFVSGTDQIQLTAATFNNIVAAGAKLTSADYFEGTLASTASTTAQFEAAASAAGIATGVDYFGAIAIGSDVYLMYDSDGHGAAGNVSLVGVFKAINLDGISINDFLGA